jgi:hypothetical protein
MTSAIPEQWRHTLIQVPQHDHRFAPDSLPLAFRPSHPSSTEADDEPRPKKLKSLGPCIRHSTDLSLFYPGPQPGYPDQAGTHDDVSVLVVQPFDWPNPSAVLYLSSQEIRSFGSFVIYLPLATCSSQIDLLSINADNLQTGGCPWLRNLEPLPPSRHPYDTSDPAASVSCSHFTRPSVE